MTSEELGKVIAQAIKAHTLPLFERLKALEERPPIGVEYAGVFEQGKAYARGSLVTKAGGLWLSLTDTTLNPGSNPTAWKLVVKSGGA